MIDTANITRVETVAKMFVEYAPHDKASAQALVEVARTLCNLKITLKGIDPVLEGDTYKHKGKEYKVVGIDQTYSTCPTDATYTELLLARV